MLTIVIPSIRPDWQRAVESVTNQTIPTIYILEPDRQRIGAGPTRNKAIKKVETEWVGFCDDDDYLDPHYHEWLVEESPGFDVVIFRMKNSPNGAVPISRELDKLKYNEVGMSFAMLTGIALSYPFKNIIGEDYELLMRLKEDGFRIKISERIAYFIGSVQ